jgi:multisubunit Na+/H+ antiporter MnhB subunit
LVDIRALDTMGEVLVLALAAVGVAALLQKTQRSPDSRRS